MVLSVRSFGLAVAVVVSVSTSAVAQQGTAPPAAGPAERKFVKCGVVLSRFQGEKRTSNLPYELLVLLGPGLEPRTAPLANLRVGIDVASTSERTRFVGISIDCGAVQGATNTYLVHLIVDDSAYAPGSQGMPTGFKSYRVSNVLSVREGQPLVFSVGTDPFSGETTRAELTVTVVK